MSVKILNVFYIFFNIQLYFFSGVTASIFTHLFKHIPATILTHDNICNDIEGTVMYNIILIMPQFTLAK